MRENRQPSRTVGILGGMGPAATVDFYDKLVRATPASRDQDHLRVVIWADPTVPDRHDAICGDGEDPTPWLEQGVDHLMRCGTQVLVAPCNTIHAFLPAVLTGRNVHFVSIVDATVDAVLRTPSSAVGILATDGALASGLYQSALRAVGREPVLLSAPSQQILMQVIYGVKAATAGEQEHRQLAGLLAELAGKGAKTVVAGCTEVSVLLDSVDTGLRVVDPSWELAVATVACATAAEGGGVRTARSNDTAPVPATGATHTTGSGRGG
jgi:aspartate racemase